MVEKIENGVWLATKENGITKYFETKKAAKNWLEEEIKVLSDEEKFEVTRNAYLY